MNRASRRQKTQSWIEKRLKQAKSYSFLDIDYIQERLNYLSKNKPLACPYGKCKCYYCSEPKTARNKHTLNLLEQEGYFEYQEDKEIARKEAEDYWNREIGWSWNGDYLSI